MNNLLILGIDGMDLNLYKKFCGSSEKYGKIMEEFSWGGMKSDIPPVTVPAWISIFTGKGPGSLGLVDFFRIKGDYHRKAVDIVSTCEGEFFWSLLKDGKVGLVGLPGIGSDYEADGFYIPGDFSSGRGNAKKLGLEEQISGRSVMRNSKSLSIAKENFEIKKRNLERLLGKEWSLLFDVFNITDRGIHCGKEHDMKEIYKDVNDFLFDIKKRCDEEGWNLMLISDHGGKKIEGAFNINTWLRENGYLEFKQEAGLLRRLGNYIYEKDPGLARTLMHSFYKTKRKLFGEEKFSRNLKLSNFVWDKTKCFAISTALTNFMPVWVNLREKFEDGCVEREDYKKLRKELKKDLLEATNPETDERLVKNVWLKEEIYSGEKMEEMPDLVVESKDEYLIEHKQFPKVFSDVERYIHALNGTFMAYGPDFKEGWEVGGSEIVDFAPTVLHLLGEEVPEDVDGEALREVFREGSDPAEREVEYREPPESGEGKDLSDKEQEEVRKKLKALGYRV